LGIPDSLLLVDAPRRTAQALAAFQAADLLVTQVSDAYGGEHLDHLGVPEVLRPLLPLIKAGAVGALLVAASRPRLRSVVGGALVAYYSAAVSFHVRSGDSATDVGPAACCALMAASLI
jgi:hypothetical protein